MARLIDCRSYVQSSTKTMVEGLLYALQEVNVKVTATFFVLFVALVPIVACSTLSNVDVPDGDRVNISSGYKSPIGVAGGIRAGLHAGMDYRGKMGSPVLAVADGVTYSSGRSYGCGLRVVLWHVGKGYTIYCHLDKVTGNLAVQGVVIGYIGISGESSWNVPHVHFEYSQEPHGHADGDLAETADPAPYIAGCFGEAVVTEERWMTHPVPCK